jgi:hypothetical protein
MPECTPPSTAIRKKKQKKNGPCFDNHESLARLTTNKAQ